MNAEMHIENGKMVYGMRSCSPCFGEGKVANRIICRTCSGSGNGKRGGKGQCQKCYGSGREYDHINKITCPVCNGVNSKASKPANRYDSMPQAVWESFEFRVCVDLPSVLKHGMKHTWASVQFTASPTTDATSK